MLAPLLCLVVCLAEAQSARAALTALRSPPLLQARSEAGGSTSLRSGGSSQAAPGAYAAAAGQSIGQQGVPRQQGADTFALALSSPLAMGMPSATGVLLCGFLAVAALLVPTTLGLPYLGVLGLGLLRWSRGQPLWASPGNMAMLQVRRSAGV